MQPSNQHKRMIFRQQESKSTAQLSRRALRRHDAVSVLPDDVYAKSLIRSEAAQLYERTMATTTGHADETPFIRPKHESLGSKSSSASELAGLPNLYRPDAQSTMTPMQRFKVLSSANDPSPWESRQAMRDAGLTEGSLETLKARVKAAVSLDADKAVLKSSSATST